MNDITKNMKEVIDLYGLSPWDINNGHCDTFANNVIERCGGESDFLFEMQTENVVVDGPGHVWIWYNGLHYDAETLNGVSDWSELSIFKRSLIKGEH